MIELLLRTEVAAGTLSQAEVDTYLADLKEGSDGGEYFLCESLFVYGS